MALEELAEKLNVGIGRGAGDFLYRSCAVFQQAVRKRRSKLRGLTEVLKEAGFTRIRRASETPFNIILEARP